MYSSQCVKLPGDGHMVLEIHFWKTNVFSIPGQENFRFFFALGRCLVHVYVVSDHFYVSASVAKRRRRKSRGGFRFSIATETTCNTVRCGRRVLHSAYWFHGLPRNFVTTRMAVIARTAAARNDLFFFSYLPTPTGYACARNCLGCRKTRDYSAPWACAPKACEFRIWRHVRVYKKTPVLVGSFCSSVKSTAKEEDVAKKRRTPLISIYFFVSTRPVKTETLARG